MAKECKRCYIQIPSNSNDELCCHCKEFKELKAEKEQLEKEKLSLSESCMRKDLRCAKKDTMIEALLNELQQLHKHFKRVVDKVSDLDCYDNYVDEIQGMIQVQEYFEPAKVRERVKTKKGNENED